MYEEKNLAEEYGQSIYAGIMADFESGSTFGYDEDNGEELDAYDYLNEALDIEYRVNAAGEYRGATIAITLGGPDARIDTYAGALIVQWGSSSAKFFLPSEFIERLDYAAGELFECIAESA